MKCYLRMWLIATNYYSRSTRKPYMIGMRALLCNVSLSSKLDLDYHVFFPKVFCPIRFGGQPIPGIGLLHLLKQITGIIWSVKPVDKVISVTFIVCLYATSTIWLVKPWENTNTAHILPAETYIHPNCIGVINTSLTSWLKMKYMYAAFLHLKS